MDDIKLSITKIKRDIDDMKQSVEFSHEELSEVNKNVIAVENYFKKLSTPTVIPNGMLRNVETVIQENSEMREIISVLMEWRKVEMRHRKRQKL